MRKAPCAGFSFILSVVFTTVLTSLFSQNLVPNPSFEEIDYCPNSSSELFYAVPWDTPSLATPDLYNECATHPAMGVPINGLGYQAAHTGAGYAGALWRLYDTPGREYMGVPLLEPLVAGQTYALSFWVSVADEYCGVNQFGAYFSNAEPYFPTNDFLPLPAQVVVTNPNTNSEDWTLISDCFVAEGGEAWMIIGNFTPNAGSPFTPGCGLDISYYFVDDVSLVPAILEDFDLGDPVIACDEYVIDPGYPGAEYQWEDGSTGSTLFVTESGVYAVTATGFCASTIDSVEITIIQFDPVDIPEDEIVICDGDSYVVSLPPTGNEYEWQDGTSGPEYTITSAGTYSVTMDDGCHQSEDEIVVEVLTPPDPFSLGPDTELCPGDVIEIEFDPEDGDFLWQDSSMESFIVITDPGHYALTISNVCGTFTSDVDVIPQVEPVVELGNNLTLCDTQSFEIILDPSMGDYLWQDDSHLNSFVIQSPGTYWVKVSNSCGSDRDTIVVSNLPSPVVNLGEDTLICPGQSLAISLDPSSGNVLWQDSSTLSTYAVLQEGTYSVTVSNQCGESSDTLIVSSPAPLSPPDLGPDLSICQGESVVLSVHVPGVSIVWQDSSTNDTLLVNIPGLYSVSILDQCSSASDTVMVTENFIPPLLDLPTQITLCQGNTIVLDAGITGVNYQWNDGTQLSTLSVSAPGTYGLTVSDLCGTAADSVIVLDGGPAPFVSLGNDLSFCAGDTIGLAPDHSDVDTWIWPDGSAQSTFTISSPGIVIVEVSNACGVSADTLEAILLPATPPLDLGNDTVICPGESVVLIILTPDVQVLWSDGSQNNTLVVQNPGTFYATVSNSCGENSDTLGVSLLPAAPVFNLGPDQSLCPGELYTITPGVPNVNYLWQDGSTGPSFSTTQPGMIILALSNSCGSNTDSLILAENTDGPQVDLGPDVAACVGQPITIHAGISGVDYLWQDGSTDATYTVSSSTTLTLQVSNNCGMDLDTVEIEFINGPADFDLGPDTLLCPGESITLFAPVTQDALQWQDGSVSSFIIATNAQTYTLKISNACGSAADSLAIAFDQDVPVIPLDSVLLWCPEETLTLDVTQSFPATYAWSTGSSSPLFQVIAPGDYSVTVSAPCVSAAEDFEVLPDVECYPVTLFYIPNIFSPNGDHINDDFIIQFNSDAEVKSLQGSIFDRWGNLVYASSTIPFTWNGQFNGEALNPGVFVYRVDIIWLDGQTERTAHLYGDVTLVR